MPNQDGTGPKGKGPKTGRGAGPCDEKTDKDTTQQQGCGMGPGRNMGPGRGMGQGQQQSPPTKKSE